MSTACMPPRDSISVRMASVHGSAPKMPISRDDPATSRPAAAIWSSTDRKYDGVTMITRGRKSAISCTCRSVIPPDTGTTVQPSASAP